MPLPPLDEQKTPEQKLEEKMQAIARKRVEMQAASHAMQQGLSYINLERFPISPEALVTVPEEEARALELVPFYRTANEIRLAVLDPEKKEIEALIARLKKEYFIDVVLALTSKESLEKSWKLYATVPKIKPVERGVSITAEELAAIRKKLTTVAQVQSQITNVSTSEQVTYILAGAMQFRASDIHIEAEEKEVKIRYRIDGILRDVGVLPKTAWKQLVARMKLLSGLKLNIEKKPQDGRFTIAMSEGKMDVRVSTLPTAFGESVVIRLLMSNVQSLAFEDLGIRGKAFEQLKREIERPNGMIMTTGPTGSGKTTSLYAMLNKLNKPGVKIITVEDPIEYELQGINQSQVDPGKGYTFAAGLRSIVRQDPDIVMVGEIRDLETAETAIQAALTGHLVLSTIHTNSAAGTIPRFLSMGVKPFLLAPALNAMIGQRLVRRLCADCKTETTLAPELLDRTKKELGALSLESGYTVDWANVKFYTGKGCATCQQIGYKGRIGIYEVLVMNKEIEQRILSAQLSEYDMQDIAIKNGMVTMVQDGLLKAIDGITTVDEVFRVAE